jgi:hypothetical protein
MATFFTIPVKKASPNRQIQRAQQRLKIELSGQTYIIDLTWIGRSSQWMIDIYDANEEPIVLSKMMSIDVNVLEDQYWDPRVPPGALGLISDIPGQVATFENFGAAVQLRYLEYDKL